MSYKLKRARNILARIATLSMLALLSTTAIVHAQTTAPLTISIEQLSPATDPVPFGSDVTYKIAVTYTGLASESAENLTIDLTAMDMQDLVVKSVESEIIGTLTATDNTFETIFTLSNVTSPTTLNVSIYGASVSDAGSAGTTTIPLQITESALVSVEYPDLSGVGGVGTPGYWKNHHEVWAGLPAIVIGDYNMNWVCDAGENCLTLSNEDALFLLNSRNYKGGKDKRYTLYRAVTAAWLNLLAGNEDSCISDTIDATIAWLAENGNPLVDGDGEPVKRKFWSGEGNELYKALDIYNNLGSGCAADRDTGEIAAGSINISDPAYRHLMLGQLPVSYLPILLQ